MLSVPSAIGTIEDENSSRLEILGTAAGTVSYSYHCLSSLGLIFANKNRIVLATVCLMTNISSKTISNNK